jgi:hypothetical protein
MESLLPIDVGDPVRGTPIVGLDTSGGKNVPGGGGALFRGRKDTKDFKDIRDTKDAGISRT